MPKQMIHCRDFGRTVPLAAAEGEPVEFATLDSTAMKVGWSKEGEHVELAVCQMVDGQFIEHGFVEEIAGDIPCEDRLRLERLTPYYIQMDRAGLNRLIRTLRQARDDAFGRDE